MTATAQRTLTLSCVILTMGNRPAEVIRAIDSVLAQHGAPVDLVVVGNGADVTGLPAGVRTVRLPENVGVAAGRNAGVAACEGDVVLFLDDDGWYPDAGLAVHLAGRFAADPSLAVLSMQVVDPDGGPGARWHVPRLRAGDPERSSVVTTFLGGACAIRRSAFLEAGGLPDLFFYGHEETDLAWRLMDRGYRLEYDATARMCHHHLPNARHDTFRRQDGRNRVLLARRNLPWPLAAVYLADWMVLTAARERGRRGSLRPWFAGFAEGWRIDPGPRRPPPRDLNPPPSTHCLSPPSTPLRFPFCPAPTCVSLLPQQPICPPPAPAARLPFLPATHPSPAAILTHIPLIGIYGISELACWEPGSLRPGSPMGQCPRQGSLCEGAWATA